MSHYLSFNQSFFEQLLTMEETLSSKYHFHLSLLLTLFFLCTNRMPC